MFTSFFKQNLLSLIGSIKSLVLGLRCHCSQIATWCDFSKRRYGSYIYNSELKPVSVDKPQLKARRPTNKTSILQNFSECMQICGCGQRVVGNEFIERDVSFCCCQADFCHLNFLKGKQQSYMLLPIGQVCKSSAEQYLWVINFINKLPPVYLCHSKCLSIPKIRKTLTRSELLHTRKLWLKIGPAFMLAVVDLGLSWLKSKVVEATESEPIQLEVLK